MQNANNKPAVSKVDEALAELKYLARFAEYDEIKRAAVRAFNCGAKRSVIFKICGIHIGSN